MNVRNQCLYLCLFFKRKPSTTNDVLGIILMASSFEAIQSASFVSHVNVDWFDMSNQWLVIQSLKRDKNCELHPYGSLNLVVIIILLIVIEEWTHGMLRCRMQVLKLFDWMRLKCNQNYYHSDNFWIKKKQLQIILIIVTWWLVW